MKSFWKNRNLFLFLLLPAACMLLPERTQADVVYHHPDHLGSSSVLTDVSGSISAESQYYPYGETFSETGGTSTDYKYTGQEKDDEIDLYYYGARYYDTQLARFLSTDPLFNPLKPSPYAYVHNNPIKMVDPDGRNAVLFMNPYVMGAGLLFLGTSWVISQNPELREQLLNVPGYIAQTIDDIGRFVTRPTEDPGGTPGYSGEDYRFDLPGRGALEDKDRISATIYSGKFPTLNYDTIYNPEDMAKEARLAAELGPHNNYVERYEDYLAIQEEFSFVDELYKTFLGAKESGVKNKIELLQFASWKGTDMRDVYRYLEDYDYDDTECISTVLGKLEHERHIVQGRLNDSAANLERARSFVDHW